MPLYLCLDQGGHASRALVLDERGTVLTRAVREVATQTPAPDRVEQDSEHVVASLVERLSRVSVLEVVDDRVGGIVGARVRESIGVGPGRVARVRCLLLLEVLIGGPVVRARMISLLVFIEMMPT